VIAAPLLIRNRCAERWRDPGKSA